MNARHLKPRPFFTKVKLIRWCQAVLSVDLKADLKDILTFIVQKGVIQTAGREKTTTVSP